MVKNSGAVLRRPTASVLRRPAAKALTWNGTSAMTLLWNGTRARALQCVCLSQEPANVDVVQCYLLEEKKLANFSMSDDIKNALPSFDSKRHKHSIIRILVEAPTEGQQEQGKVVLLSSVKAEIHKSELREILNDITEGSSERDAVL